MSLQTRPLHPTLACEIDGLRLWEPLDAATIAELGSYGRIGASWCFAARR